MKNLGLLFILVLSAFLVNAQNTLSDNSNPQNNIVDIDNYINASLFPNPNKGEFSIKMENDQPYDVTIYAMNGMVVYNKKNLEETTHRIELESSIAKGFYSVAIRQGNDAIIKKLIIR